jgi:predicted hydrolase (HD superfamily)
MIGAPMDRERAYALLCEHTASESLRKHGLAVEAAMRHFARRFGEDESEWAVVGILHDFDYEKFPEQHPQAGKSILEAAGLEPKLVRAIQSHGDHTGVTRESRLEKTLYAVDELTGFVVAVALVRPGKDLSSVDAAAVRKKMKDKAFARAVDRAAMQRGAEDLGMPFDELVGEVVSALRGIAPQLGLAA